MQKAKLLFPVLFGTLAGCGTLGGGRAEVQDGAWIEARTFVDSGAICSVGDAPNLEDSKRSEGLFATLAAPLLAEIGGKSINALGNAIKAAGAKSDKSFTTASASGAFAQVSSKPPGGTQIVYLPEVELQGMCVRTVVASIVPDNATEDADASLAAEPTPAPPSYDELGPRVGPDEAGGEGDVVVRRFVASPADNLFQGKDTAALTKSVSEVLSDRLSGKIEHVFYYSEYLVYPLDAKDPEGLYLVAPMIIWYPDSVHGARYHLVSSSLEFRSPFANDASKSMAYSQLHGPSGLNQGTLYIWDSPDGPFWADMTLVKASVLSTEENKPLEAARTAAKAFMNKAEFRPNIVLETFKDEGGLTASGFAGLLGDETANLQEQSEKECIIKAAKSQDKIDVCELQSKLADLRENNLLPYEYQAAIQASETAVAPLEGATGLFSVALVLNETRDANRFLTAVGDALVAQEDETKTSLETYLAGQLGVTKDAEPKSDTPEQNDYRLARLEYDIAKRKYAEAQLTGDQATIDDTLTTLVREYGELAVAAEAAGETLTEPAPY